MNAASASAACQLFRFPWPAAPVTWAAYSPAKTLGPVRSYVS